MNILYTEFLKTHTGCPFCAPDKNDVISENKLAFLACSIAPYSPYHMMVIPKRHVLDYVDFTREERDDVDLLIAAAIRALETLGMMDYSIMVRSGDKERIGKSVDHLHFHVIPTVRLVTEGVDSSKRTVMSPAEIGEVVKKIKEVI